MAKLWEKNDSLDALMEAFTVGEDPVLDRRLVNADCVASMAHATMLAEIGVLSAADRDALLRELSAIIGLNGQGRFAIQRSDEDVHTAIENHLVKALGDAGKRIHTGRSRNDQVAVALRLWTRGFLLCCQEAALSLAARLLDLADRHARTPMPGRTHMQIAMPSSVGLWAAAFAEELLDDAALLKGVFELQDSCPLGSAASYGVPLPTNREMLAELLGFGRVQNNVLYAQNSRGKFESMVLEAVEQVTLTLSKMAQDLILFSLPEFGYFSLPPELCTGSSIMPQKKNPDGLELMRAKSAAVSADAMAVKSIIRSLPTGYNRDVQETKAPFFRGCETGLACIRVMDLTIERLVVNGSALKAAFTPEIFAADRALELVAGGVPFRDAYREVGANLGSLGARDPVESIARKTATGAPGNLRLDVPRAAAAAHAAWLRATEGGKADSVARLAGRGVALFQDPLGRDPTA
jgi:argininosuccinate lyase